MKKLFLFALHLLIGAVIINEARLSAEPLAEIPSIEMKCHEPKQGPPGPSSGGVINAYGSFYVTGPIDGGGIPLSFDEQVPFNLTSSSLNTSLTGTGSVVINIPGNYLVTYGVSIFQLTTSAPTAHFKLTLNGTDVPGSFSSWIADLLNNIVYEVQAVSVIVPVTAAGSVLELVNISTGGDGTVTISSQEQNLIDTSAYISVLLLSDTTPI